MIRKIGQTRKSEKHWRGFTIVELLISMGIVSVLLTVITQVFMQVIETRLEAEAASAIAEDGRYIYGRLAYDINRANQIVTPANPGEIGSTLTLEIEGVDHTYTLNSGNLILDNGTVTAQLNGAGSVVNNISFTRIGEAGETPTVQFELGLDSVVQTVRGASSMTIGSTIGVR